MSKVKVYAKYIVGALAAIAITVAPMWAVDALAAHSVEVDGTLTPFKTIHNGQSFIEVGPFDAFLGEMTTDSAATTIPLSLIKDNMLDFDGTQIMDAKIMKTGKLIPGTEASELKLVLTDSADIARDGSGIQFTNNESIIQSVTCKDGEDVLLQLPKAVTTEKSYAWYNIIGFTVPMEDKKTGVTYEVTTYYALDVDCEADGSVKIEDASARTDNGVYMCFTTDAQGRYTGVAAMYNLAFETDLVVTVPTVTTTARLGGAVTLKVNIATSNVDKLEVQWVRGDNTVVQYKEGIAGATYKISAVEWKDFGEYSIMVSDGVSYKTVKLKLVRDKNDKLPTVGLITAIKTQNFTDTSIRLQWNRPKYGTKFAIYRRVGNTWKLIGATTGTAYTCKGLNPATKYTFAVRPYTNYYGVNVKAKLYKAINSFTRPAGITQLNASQSSGHGAIYRWNKAKGATGYTVFIKSGNTWKKVKNVKGTTYTTPYLKTGVKYTYAVRSYTVINGKVVYAPNMRTMQVWYTAY